MANPRVAVIGIGPVGSCGRATPDLVLNIFDEQGLACAPGQAGEICFQQADGSAPPVAYFKNHEASAHKVAGGWLHMGDIGHVAEDGWLYFHHRQGAGIRRNGEFINPADIEKLLSELDAVDDVFVYGMPISGGAPGEKAPVAAIVPKSGVEFDPARVFARCQQNLPRNAVPRYLQLMDDIPKTASEKPQERLLLQAFAHFQSSGRGSISIKELCDYE